MIKDNGSTDALLCDLIKLTRKNVAIMAEINKKLDKIIYNEPKEKKKMPNPDLTDIQEKAKAAIEEVEDSFVPKLNDNEKTLEICHVVKDGTLYTFNKGKMVDEKKATPLDCYLYRKA